MFKRKSNTDDYSVKLRELNHRHHLALEQYKKSYPRFKVNPENKVYSAEFNKDKFNLRNVNAKLFLLENEILSGIKEQEKKISKGDSQIKKQKRLNDLLNNLEDDQTDKDEALIAMANDLKEAQSEKLMYLFDIGLGISLLGLFIYNKTRNQ